MECTVGFWRRIILGQHPVGPCDHGSCPAAVVGGLVDDFEIHVLASSALNLREDGGVLRTEVLADVVDGGGSEPDFVC